MATIIDGDMLQKVRKVKRLSQQKLADISGVGIATIKRIEKEGPYNCRAVQAERLAKALGVEVHDLSEDVFDNVVVDIGEDVELHLSRDFDEERFRAASEKLISLMKVRRRIISRPAK